MGYVLSFLFGAGVCGWVFSKKTMRNFDEMWILYQAHKESVEEMVDMLLDEINRLKNHSKNGENGDE